MKKLLCIALSVVFITAVSLVVAFAATCTVQPTPTPTPNITGSSHTSSTGNGGSTTTPGTQSNINKDFNGKSTGSENTGFPNK